MKGFTLWNIDEVNPCVGVFDADVNYEQAHYFMTIVIAPHATYPPMIYQEDGKWKVAFIAPKEKRELMGLP